MSTVTQKLGDVCEGSHTSSVSWRTQEASWNRVGIPFNGILSYSQPGALLAHLVVQAGSLDLEILLSHLLARDIGRLH